MESSYSRLFALLSAFCAEGVFNQYRDEHPELDRPQAAALRRRNLRAYLHTFEAARYVLIGEAAGYAGCRFSGIPFTSEAQLVGRGALDWAARAQLDRSSTGHRLWVERSARMVWEILGARTDCLLWNAFPWHPYGPRGPLSNRQPGPHLGSGLEVLRCLLDLFPAARPYAVGRVAQQALASLGVEAPYVRHPSHGGKARFAAGVAALPARPHARASRRDRDDGRQPA